MAGCSRPDTTDSATASTPQARPSILLVTLDTTRADSIGPGRNASVSPAFNALAARGRRYVQAYATVPETLPSHASIMTGLYAAGHGVQPASDSEYPMALFKRAQVAVLLNEPDSAARITQARKHADATTRALIAQERLFRQTSR